MPAPDLEEEHEPVAIPPIVDQLTWEAALAELRTREKAATRELDAIAAARGGYRWWRPPSTPSKEPTVRLRELARQCGMINPTINPSAKRGVTPHEHEGCQP